jgi:hypothetical protein
MTRPLMLAILLAGCATESAVERATQGASLDEKQARQIIEQYENRHQIRAASANEPLRTPKSLDDVVEVLKLDRIDLFPESIKFATTQQGPQSLALRAQIELAWGEGQQILADLLGNASTQLRADVRSLEQKAAAGAKLDDEEQKSLASLKEVVTDLAGIEEALHVAGGKHIESGATLAKLVIDQAPNDYHGYRVAADYYRLRGDWSGFDQMVKKLEETNPKSNGLLFARGMEALLRHGDRLKAQQLFRECLERDPKFARAQVQLLLAQMQGTEAWNELKKLESISPRHQIVVWAGPAIKSQRDRSMAQQRRLQQRLQDQAAGAAIR